MGDLFFDLASVSYFFAPEQKDYLLECYFGAVTEIARHTLEQLWYVVAFWNAAWALLQIGNLTLILIMRGWRRMSLRGWQRYCSLMRDGIAFRRSSIIYVE